jgi:hypothetical protein
VTNDNEAFKRRLPKLSMKNVNKIIDDVEYKFETLNSAENG